MNDVRSRIAKLSVAAARLKHAAQRQGPFHLALLSDERILPPVDPVIRFLPDGSAFIFRQYNAPQRLRLARRLKAYCHANGVLFYVAGDVRAAQAVGADGVHLPSRLLRRHLNTTGLLISAACHSAEDLCAAAQIGAHSAFLSPVFATRSHPGAEYLGPERFAQLARAARLPVIALGGVNADNVPRLDGSGAAGFGAIDAFFPRG